MNKSVTASIPLQAEDRAPGFRSIDLYDRDHALEPFLVFTEFHMDRPIFGPHPHAGVSVLTYMLPDSPGGFLNRDSRGDHSQILPGGLHVTQAGNGVRHDETPLEPGVDCHGFQIWINHSAANRLVEPAAFHLMPSEVPVVRTEAATVRVLLGGYAETPAAVELITPTLLLHVQLQPGQSLQTSVPERTFAFLIEGSLEGQSGPCLLQFGDGDSVDLKAGPVGAHFMLAGGVPHGEPIVYGGPFVMTTDQEMRETRLRFGRGEMGPLDPLK